MTLFLTWVLDDRDRYGFDIYSEHYSIRDYLEFAEKYEKVTMDQQLAWQELVTPFYPDLPSPSVQVRDAIRSGIPTCLRGKVRQGL
jgi:hypothetical protein